MENVSMLDFSQLSEISFWFDPALRPMSAKTSLVLGSFFLFLILLKFIGRLFYLNYKKSLQPPEKKLISSIESLLITMGFAGLAWVFFAYENIPFLSARFWMLVWLLGFIVWAYMIGRYAFIALPEALNALQAQKRREKYLP